MGTNYHVIIDECPEVCGRCFYRARVHLGKSSVGWRFLHRGYREGVPDFPDMKITGRESWLRLLDLGRIVDEYGREVGKQELLEFIEAKQGHKREGSPEARAIWQPDEFALRWMREHNFTDGEYDFCDAEFF